MHRMPAFVAAMLLGCSAGIAAAAPAHEQDASARDASHHAAVQLKEVAHRIGSATRHALQRVDAALHRGAHGADGKSEHRT